MNNPILDTDSNTKNVNIFGRMYYDINTDNKDTNFNTTNNNTSINNQQEKDKPQLKHKLSLMDIFNEYK